MNRLLLLSSSQSVDGFTLNSLHQYEPVFRSVIVKLVEGIGCNQLIHLWGLYSIINKMFSDTIFVMGTVFVPASFSDYAVINYVDIIVAPDGSAFNDCHQKFKDQAIRHISQI